MLNSGKMILRVAIFLVIVISAQAVRRQQPRGDTGTQAMGRASSCIITSRAIRFDDEEVISGRQNFGQNGGLYIPPTTDADDDDDDEEEEPDVEQQDEPGGAEDDEEQEQYEEDDEEGGGAEPAGGPPLINLAALFPALAGLAGGPESAVGPSIPHRPPIVPGQYLDPGDIDTELSGTSGPEQYYGDGPISNYGGGGGGGYGGGHGGGCRRCHGGKGGKGGRRRHKKRRHGNINCIIITKDKKHKKPHKHKPLTVFGIPITSRRRRSMARRLRALKLQ